MKKLLQKVFSVKNEKTHKVITILGFKIAFKDKNAKASDYINYVKFLENSINEIPTVSYVHSPRFFNTRLIAFYLPQFYPIPLNNDFHGKGFTE